MKKYVRGLISAVFVLLLIVGTVLGYLTVDEYKPADVEDIIIAGSSDNVVTVGTPMRVMTWNLGYGALGDNADFFMDGGKMVKTADKARVYSNLDDIRTEIENVSPDILFTQEIDIDSTRSFFIDESAYFMNNSSAHVFDGQYAYATNLRVSFIPIPVPPLGRMESGIETFTDYKCNSARRVKLPCPFKWPLSTINLKRGLQVMRFPVEGSDKELVLVNLHLEAYDSGEGKIEQTGVLKELLLSEVDKGNYVIAGGDFNQTFSDVDASAYPQLEGLWVSPIIDVTEFGDQLTFYTDSSVPTCRSLDSVLTTAPDRSPSKFQYYMLDGFIVSSNIDVESVRTDDLGFVASDHNPVILDFRLK